MKRQLVCLGLSAFACQVLISCSRDRRTSNHQSRTSGLVTPGGAITGTADDLRTGWYPDQPRLSPAVVGGPTFGRLWRTALPLTAEDQVFAQPLVMGSTVLVATESNNLYALDSETGAIKAMRALGAPWRAADVGCADLRPNVGVTGTPVVDVATRTAYLFSKTYVNGTPSADPANTMWRAHAVDVDTLAERPNFPVRIDGAASNQPSLRFGPFYQLQRPALLLMNGVVYAGFGGHCDAGDFRGWVVGVGTDAAIKTLFVTEVADKGGAGIWHSGGGLVSDGPGRIFFTTGNTFHEADDTPQAAPSGHLGQSVVRLQVQADGSLRAADWFAPYNRSTLDVADTDFGLGGPVALPANVFGTPAHPRLLLAGGKAGILYVLDRDRLGGLGQGSGGGDAVVSAVNAAGGMWSRPAVWPGEGGHVYVLPNSQPLQVFRHGVSGDGRSLFTEVGRSETPFGYTSGSPIVTSDGTTAGTALVWLTFSSSTYGDALLRAYDAVPGAGGRLRLRFEERYGVHAKFAVPGVGDGRIYVGSADGHVLAYGAPIRMAMSGPALNYGQVVTGTSATRNAVFTANQELTVTALSISGDGFLPGPSTPPLPATLASGATLTVPVNFAPTTVRMYAASLDAQTTAGAASLSLEGRGEAAAALLVATPRMVSFGGLARGRTSTANAVLRNAGAQPLTWSSFTPPAAPFGASNLPAVGGSLAPGAEVTVSFSFAPTAVGMFSGSLAITSTGGEAAVFMSGSAGEPPLLSIAPLALDFGTIRPGATASRSFTLTNSGGSDLTITKSKPPGLGVFVARSPLDEGTVVGPGQGRAIMVSFAPSGAGTFRDQWQITGDDSSGPRLVNLVGMAALLADAGPADAGQVVDVGPGLSPGFRERALAPLVGPELGPITRRRLWPGFVGNRPPPSLTHQLPHTLP